MAYHNITHSASIRARLYIDSPPQHHWRVSLLILAPIFTMTQMKDRTPQAVLGRVDAFIKGISRSDRVCIVHDTDPDGICAAVILAKYVQRMRKKKIELRMGVEHHSISDEMLRKMKKARINTLITADFSLDQHPQLVKRLEKFCRILIVDHHKFYNDVTSRKTVLYKPQLFTDIEPARYCTAKMAYDAAARGVDVSDVDWMAVAGCIADIATAPWMPWVRSVFRKYDARLKKNMFQTLSGEVAATITSAEAFDKRLVKRCFDLFYGAKGPKDVLKSELGKCKKAIDKELDKWVKKFGREAEKYGDLRIFEIAPKYPLHGPISTILGLKYPHNTIVIVNMNDDFLAVSARRGDKKIAVNTLLENAIKGFNGANAGGHVPAAGAGFYKKDYSVFKERIIAMAGGTIWR